MPEPNYQTIRLSKGKHISPAAGACVMELASMLAREPFSDRPQSVSPPIAAFLRCYNDRLDDRRRQDLYEYAAKVVGSVSTPDVECARARRLVHWADDRRRPYARWSALARFRSRAEPDRRLLDPESVASYAIRTVRRISDDTHAEVLDLVDELIEIGAPREGGLSATSPHRRAAARGLGCDRVGHATPHRAPASAYGSTPARPPARRRPRRRRVPTVSDQPPARRKPPATSLG